MTPKWQSLAAVTTFMILLALPALGDEPMKSGRVEANGVNYYYEIHGQGEPLLLLHGGLGSIGMFEPDLPALARNARSSPSTCTATAARRSATARSSPTTSATISPKCS